MRSSTSVKASSQELSPDAQQLIRSYTRSITEDSVDLLDLHNGRAIGQFFHTPVWPVPFLADYETAAAETEYTAWVVYNRYYLIISSSASTICPRITTQ